MGEGIFDILGLKPGFNYKGHSHSTSNCGRFTGFLILCFLVWAFYQVGKDIFDRRDPQVVTSRIFIEDPGQILIEPDSFIFALGLERPDNFAHYIDPGIYSLKAVHYNMKRVPDAQGNINLVFTEIDLDLERCREDHFGSKKSMFANLELSSMYCLKPNQTKLDFVDIKGKFEVDEVSFLRFKFSVCNNVTTGGKCKPKEDIDFLLDGAYFAVYYSDASIQPGNFTQPERMYMDAQFTTFGKSYFKEYQIWIGHNEMTTDSGWLFEDISLRKSLSYDFTKELLDFRVAGDEFFEFQLRVSPFYNYYTRKYIKVQEIIADVEGLLTVILILIAIIILPYIKLKYYEELIGDVFDVYATLDRDHNKPYHHHNHEDMTIVVPKMKAKEDHAKLKIKDEIKSSPNLTPTRPINFPKDSKKKPSSIIRQDSLENNLNRSPRKVTTSNTEKATMNTAYTQTSSRIKKDISLFTNKPETVPLFSPVNNKIVSEIDINSSLIAETPEPKLDLALNNNSTKVTVPEDKPEQIPPSSNLRVTFPDLKSPPLSIVEEEHPSPAKRVGSKKKSVVFDYGDLDEDKFIYKSVANINDDNLRIGISMNMLPEEARIIRQTRRVKTAVEPNPKNKFGVTLIEYFRSFFSDANELKKKMKIIKEGQRRIVERLDVFNILKKMREIDKLKALLLDQEQLILFDYLPKPVIDYNEMLSDPRPRKEGHESLGVLRDPDFIKIRQAVFQDAFQTLMKKEDKTEIDIKLLEIYEGLV